MKTQPKINKSEIKSPTVSITHTADGTAAFPTGTWKSVSTGCIGRTAGPAMSQHRALPHCSLIKYSTASLDFVFPKKWRPPRLMDPGEVGLRLEPAPERVEGASAPLSGSATDQRKSGTPPCPAGRAGAKKARREPCGWGQAKRSFQIKRVGGLLGLPERMFIISSYAPLLLKVFSTQQ